MADDITQEVVGVDQLRPAAAYLAGPWLSHLIVDAALMAVGYDLLFNVPPGG